MKKKTNSPAKEPTVVVTDLRDVEAHYRKGFSAEVLICGKAFTFEGRRLIPVESDRFRRMMELALPPVIPASKEGEEPRYDFNDVKYRDQANTAKIEARAFALWLGYPTFKKTADAMVMDKTLAKLPETEQEIAAFIQGRNIDDDALQLLLRALTSSQVELQAFVNFTSGNGSPKS